MSKTHKDCKFYLNVDVFKGICKIDKNKINADEIACERFLQIEQCQFCLHYSPLPHEQYAGLCMNKADTHPNLTAKTCENFSWKEKT